MILGVGNDVVQVSRVKKVWEKFPQRFALRILDSQEFEQYLQCNEYKKPRFLAKKFAIKEAASKALGMGMRQGVSFNEFVESRSQLNQPLLSLRGVALQCSQKKSADSAWHVSVSDENDLVYAVVIWEKL